MGRIPTRGSPATLVACVVDPSTLEGTSCSATRIRSTFAGTTPSTTSAFAAAVPDAISVLPSLEPDRDAVHRELFHPGRFAHDSLDAKVQSHISGLRAYV